MQRSINKVNECLAYKAKHGHHLTPMDYEEHWDIIYSFQDVFYTMREREGHRVRFTMFNQVVHYDKNSTKGLGFI